MQNERFKDLFNRYILKEATGVERAEFFGLVRTGLYDNLLEKLADESYTEGAMDRQKVSVINEEKVFDAIIQRTVRMQPVKTPKKRQLWVRYAVAAGIACCFGVGLYFYQVQNEARESARFASQILPAGDRAKLVLANGKVISLDASSAGTIASEAGVEIVKTADGEIVYHVVDAKTAGSGNLNTISTPRGGKYKVKLPDGTGVWLNAATSLQYPSSFKGMTREVNLTGEAYFEVAKDEDKKFIVNTKGQFVEVIGTHFNISAYADDDVQTTTLLEGAIKAGNPAKEVLLKPGQQVQHKLGSSDFKLLMANMETTMAWKNGDFIFKEENLLNLMKEVERWYDVEVVFDEDIDPEKIKLGGWVSRSKNIGAVLKIVETVTGLNLKVHERRVTISK